MPYNMCMRRDLVLSLLTASLCGPMFAQSWSGIIDPSRAIDWSGAGIPGGIPQRTTQAGATIAPYSGSCATIQNAFAAAPANTYVHLGTGTFTISGGCNFVASGAKNVTIRGDGPMNTIFVFTSGVGCLVGSADVCFKNGFSVGSDNAFVNPPCGSGGAANCADWVGGYSKGATSITLANVGANAPHVGDLLMLDQANETTNAAGLVQCDTIGPCSQNGGAFGRIIGGSPARSGGSYVNASYSQVQVVRITAINGNTYTISPGLEANNWRASQTPGAWWSTNGSSRNLSGVGIEGVTLDHSISSGQVSGIQYAQCYQCWVQNVRSLMSQRNHVCTINSANLIIRDSYFFGVKSGGGTESYGFEPQITSDSLVENNIFDQISSPMLLTQGNGIVFSYNFSWNNPFPNNYMQTNTVHDAGNYMNLMEGNSVNGFTSDDAHGASPLTTVFRNWIPGQMPAPYVKTTGTNSFELDPLARAWNIVGNVLGTLSCTGGSNPGAFCRTSADCTGGGSCTKYHTTVESSPIAGHNGCANTSIYNLGWGNANTCSNSSLGGYTGGNDNTVMTSLLRWGNYDTVTGAAQWNASEVPTASMNFVNGNPVPASQSLPPSFYLAGTPAFWGTMPWPAAGPDVSGGIGPGGHAYAIPAQLCYNNTGKDSSGRLLFDASACYYGGGSSGPPPPQPPPSMSAVPH